MQNIQESMFSMSASFHEKWKYSSCFLDDIILDTFPDIQPPFKSKIPFYVLTVLVF